MARIITLTLSAGDPTEETDQVILYSKDDGGVIKPYVILSDGTVVELSGGGGGITLDDVRVAIGDTADPLLGAETVNTGALTVGGEGGTPKIQLKTVPGEVETAQLSFTLSTTVSASGNLSITSQGTSQLTGVNTSLIASNNDDSSSALIFMADDGFDMGIRIRDYSAGAALVSQIQVTRGNGVTIQGTTDSCMLTLEAGGSAAIAPASTGRIRYNSSAQRFEVSENNTAYKALNAPFGATGYVTLDTATEKTILTTKLPSVADGAVYAVDFHFVLPQAAGGESTSQSVAFTVETVDEAVTFFSVSEGGNNFANREYSGRVIIAFGAVVGPDQNVMRSWMVQKYDPDTSTSENAPGSNGPELIATPIDDDLRITIEITAAADTGEEQIAHATISRLA